MKKITKRLLLFTSAATIATSSIAYKLSHDTQTGFIKDFTDFFSDDDDFSILAHKSFSSLKKLIYESISIKEADLSSPSNLNSKSIKRILSFTYLLEVTIVPLIK